MAEIILGPVIGGLTHNSANLWVRADKSATLHVWLGISAGSAKQVGKARLEAKNGFAGMVRIKGLAPHKRYRFAVGLDSKSVPPKSAYSSFRTFPSPGKPMPLKFAFGSCFLPIREGPGLAFKHIREHQGDIAFLLMLGDQVYADESITNGLGRPALVLKDYRKVYAHVWSNRHHRDLLTNSPAFMILDDHEVDNDWHWTDRKLTKPDIASLTHLIRKFLRLPEREQHITYRQVQAALKANWEHQAMHAPVAVPPKGPLFYEFEYGSVAFFMLDTRTQRFHNRDERQLLGNHQWNRLVSWLKRTKDTHPVKFIISSISVLTDLIADPTDDRWTGFKEERNRLLEFLANEGIEGVHFLVGDLHSAHVVSCKLKGPQGRLIPIWEFCSSPFEQKPNKIAWLTNWPARSPYLQDRKRHFTISQINYGIVTVEYQQKKPQVRFELHYEKDGTWFTA